MSILTLQRRLRELGRIRTGVKVAGSNGRSRPAKLETFRLTSPSRELLEAAAEIYGGEVRAWPEGDGWELVTKVDALDIIIPPGDAMSQFFEMWSGGGCQRRCDGVTNLLTMEPCLCPADQDERRTLAADGKACKPTTRLNVILPLVPDMGVWRLESHGYYAAVELAGTAEFLARATAEGRLLPARLRLDQREAKRPGQPTNRYAVPVIELPQTRIAEMMPELGPGPGVKALAAGSTDPRRQSTRRQRVERPAPGATTPDLPADSRMEKPTAPFGTAQTVGGWPVEEPAVIVARDPLVDAEHATRAEFGERGNTKSREQAAADVVAKRAARVAASEPEDMFPAKCGSLSDPALGEIEECVMAAGHLDVAGSQQRHQAASGSIWPAGKGGAS